jgi:hypothetical protein
MVCALVRGTRQWQDSPEQSGAFCLYKRIVDIAGMPLGETDAKRDFGMIKVVVAGSHRNGRLLIPRPGRGLTCPRYSLLLA